MTSSRYPGADGEIPAFAAAHQEGLRDFWHVYDAHYERVAQATLDVAKDHPDLGPLLRATPPEQQAAQNQRSRDLLRRALVDGDWASYVEDLRTQGAHYATIALSFPGWYDVVRSLKRVLVPLLVETFAREPDRLSRALTAMLEFIDYAMATIAQQYLETKETVAVLALCAAKDSAEAASRELEAFSYSVAHDLRAPLRGINGFSDALLEDCSDKLDPQARDYLRRIAAGSERMGRLIDALLSLSRVARVEVRRQPVNLGDLARSVVEQLRATHPDRSVEFVCAPDLVANGDPSLLRALFDNLLGNAWKFTARRAHARVELGRDDGGGVPAYFVRDNGAGFDMAYASKLFAPFQRLHSPGEFTGTGIGLATVERIVRRHDGRVWAEGRVGEGATFHFTLSPAPRAGDPT